MRLLPDPGSMRIFLFYLAIVILSTSCAYKKLEVVEVKSVHVDEFSSKKVKITASLVLRNPNNFKVTISQSDLDLYLNGEKVATAAIKKRIELPENTEMIHDLVIDSSLNDVGIGALSSLFSVISRGVVKIGIKGSVKASAFKKTEWIPVDIEGDVKVDVEDFFNF